MIRLETATADDFAPFVGSEFALHSGSQEVPLTLTEATAREHHAAKGRPFTLLFSGSPQPPLPQSIYALTHPEAGSFEIFLVPVSGDDVHRIYEAVFA